MSFLGCLTHPLLDWQTSYAVQLLSPFSNLWFHNDSLFIIDVWIWTGLSLAIWLSRRREKAGQGNWRRPAVIALVALLAYIAGNGVFSAQARQAPRMEKPYATPDVTVVSPPPVAFWRREVIWRQGHEIQRGQADLLLSQNQSRDVVTTPARRHDRPARPQGADGDSLAGPFPPLVDPADGLGQARAVRGDGAISGCPLR